MSQIEKIKVISRNLLKDKRGWFLKVITGDEENLSSMIGEVYLTMGAVGEIKGGHFHRKSNEWFTVISGVSHLFLEDVVTHEKKVIPLDLNTPQTIFVPPMVAHAFKNIGKTDMIVVAYTDRQYEAEDTITYNLKENE